jgi:hypothetical protein
MLAVELCMALEHSEQAAPGGAPPDEATRKKCDEVVSVFTSELDALHAAVICALLLRPSWCTQPSSYSWDFSEPKLFPTDKAQLEQMRVWIADFVAHGKALRDDDAAALAGAPPAGAGDRPAGDFVTREEMGAALRDLETKLEAKLVKDFAARLRATGALNSSFKGAVEALTGTATAVLAGAKKARTDAPAAAAAAAAPAADSASD